VSGKDFHPGGSNGNKMTVDTTQTKYNTNNFLILLNFTVDMPQPTYNSSYPFVSNWK
jgi:hypothetical protein